MTGSDLFGRWVKQRRKALDLTQAELARQVGCAEITIRKIEASEIRPSRHFITRLAELLDIDLAERAAFIAAGRGHTQQPFNNLLAPPNPLVGREQELALIRVALAAPDVRLLTLSGPGGVGKTRLALQVALELLGDFRDGVCFVALATITDPMLLGSTIAQALELTEAGGQAIDELLKSYLRDKHMLLVLDNFEQVAAAAPLIAAILASAPQLKVLVTSRVVLHLSGEHELPVPPLALPNVHALPPIAVLSQYAAVSLFVARARAARSGFALTPANAVAIAEICARLDGLPLAIELAAAWIKLLAPQELLAKLEQRLCLLTGGPRDLPTRQQTLRSTIAWSYNLLDAFAQALFRRLAVFPAGCTLDAVEAICATPAAVATETGSVLPGLLSLIDQSLLRQEEQPDGSARFVMLQTLREFALECLVASAEEATYRQRHACYYLKLAEAAKPHLQDTEQEAWLERLETEHDNLRAALDWCCRSPEAVEIAWRLIEVLWEFWLVRGYISEGRAWIATILARPAPTPLMSVRARVLCGGGRLAWAQNDWVQASRLLEESLAISRDHDDAASAATLNYLGQVAEAQGHYERAAVLFDQSLALFHQLGDREGSATALTSRAQIAQAQGDYERAATLLERSLRLFEELGDRRGWAAALTVQGQIRHTQGQYREAVELFEAALAAFQSLGYRHGMAWALTNLGQVVQAQRDYERAATLFEQSIALFQELGDRRGIAWGLTNQGHAAALHGDHARAVVLLDRSVRLFQELGDRRGCGWTLIHRGQVAQTQGDARAAARYFAESLRLFAALDDHWYCAESIAGLAAALMQLAHLEAAARLFAAAERLRDSSEQPSNIIDHSAMITALREQLSLERWTAAVDAGQSLTFAQTIADALELAQTIAANPRDEPIAWS